MIVLVSASNIKINRLMVNDTCTKYRLSTHSLHCAMITPSSAEPVVIARGFPKTCFIYYLFPDFISYSVLYNVHSCHNVHGSCHVI